MISRGTSALLSLVYAPQEGAAKAQGEPMPWFYSCIFSLLVIVGLALQAPALHYASYSEDASDPATQAAATALLHPPLVQDVINWLIVLAIYSIGLWLAVAFVTIFTKMCGGEISVKASRSAVTATAALTIGGFFLTNGVATFLSGADSFRTVGSLLHVIPSALWFVPTTNVSFGSAALSAINPFLIWAFVLYLAAFQSAGVSRQKAVLGATIVAVASVAARGALGAILGY